jgi:transcriptional regulator with XRE-family HTH domain
MNMKAARRASGLTLRRYAAEIGVTVNTVRRYEQGKREPTEQRVIAIEQLLTRQGVNLAEIEAQR